MAFWGGVFAGVFRLSLDTDPLKTWVERTSSQARVSVPRRYSCCCACQVWEWPEVRPFGASVYSWGGPTRAHYRASTRRCVAVVALWELVGMELFHIHRVARLAAQFPSCPAPAAPQAATGQPAPPPPPGSSRQ